MKKLFKNGKFKYDAFSFIMTIIIIGIIIIINLFVARLNISFDLTEDKLFTLTDETINVLNELDENINIYVLSSIATQIDILDEYEKNSTKINVEFKDPDLYPDFINKFINYNNGNYIETNSIIVEGSKNSKVISPSQLQSESTFNVEHEITNAILYIQSDFVKETIYYVTGHGELPLEGDIITQINSLGLNFKNINLTLDDLPDDISTLFLTTPSLDYSKSELNKINEFIGNGGHALIFYESIINNLENVTNFLKNYGVAIEKEIILEGDTTLSVDGSNTGFFIKPSNNELIELGLQGPLVFEASPIKILEERRQSILINSILSSSEMSYIKSDPNSSAINKEPNDIKGPFDVAISIVEKNPNGTSGNIVFMSTSILLNKEFEIISGNVNSFYLLQFLNILSNERTLVDIPKKSLVENNIMILTNAQKRNIITITFILLPSIIMGSGIFIWLRRRHK